MSWYAGKLSFMGRMNSTCIFNISVLLTNAFNKSRQGGLERHRINAKSLLYSCVRTVAGKTHVASHNADNLMGMTLPDYRATCRCPEWSKPGNPYLFHILPRHWA